MIVAKGKSVQTFAPAGAVSAELLASLLGPTGNLRAPTLVAGDTLIIGWNEDAYRDALL